MNTTSVRRTHIVLIPGFVGFDALGQVHYYAGVTELLGAWKVQNPRAPHVSLHYFDNFPTASVALRATRLAQYLAKRYARGEFAPGDRIAVVGHSTGGLDIRRALDELANRTIAVDGRAEVSGQDVLKLVDRLVFVSVPHYGTNLADAACKIRATIQVMLKGGEKSLGLNREALTHLRSHLPNTKSGLLLAVADALNESDEDSGGFDGDKAAEREARSQLSLFLDHIGKDFGIIADLRSYVAGLDGPSPAHYSLAHRETELARWKNLGISTRSYATIVSRRHAAEPSLLRLLPLFDHGAPLLDKGSEAWRIASDLPLLSGPLSLLGTGVVAAPLLLVLAAAVHHRPSALFELFHAVCADPAGLFADPASLGEHSRRPDVVDFVTREKKLAASIAVGDSDGVVNTLSMLWPYDPSDPDRHQSFLVESDHGDIIGHYAEDRLAAPLPGGRKYYAYDFFPSGSGFDTKLFREVWHDIFEFCVN